MPRRSNHLWEGEGEGEGERKKKTASVERLKKRMDNRDSCLNLFTLQTLPLQEENTHSSRKEEGKGWRERERETRGAWPRASSKTKASPRRSLRSAIQNRISNFSNELSSVLFPPSHRPTVKALPSRPGCIQEDHRRHGTRCVHACMHSFSYSLPPSSLSFFSFSRQTSRFLHL